MCLGCEGVVKPNGVREACTRRPPLDLRSAINVDSMQQLLAFTGKLLTIQVQRTNSHSRSVLAVHVDLSVHLHGEKAQIVHTALQPHAKKARGIGDKPREGKEICTFRERYIALWESYLDSIALKPGIGGTSNAKRWRWALLLIGLIAFSFTSVRV